MGSGADLASETVFGSIFDQCWLQLGAVLGVKLGPSWCHVGQKLIFEGGWGYCLHLGFMQLEVSTRFRDWFG